MKKSIIWLAAILLAAALAGPARAQIDQEYAAAPAIDAQGWINSPPLSPAGLRGKVVVVEFWDYTSISCIRALPYLRMWQRLYGPMGLVVIGVHTPEFDFARDPGRVAEAVKRLGIDFPVALDCDRRVWNAFHNEGWPCEYLIDGKGQLDYSHCGDRDYGEFERLIQQLLKRANPSLDFSSARFSPRPDAQAAGASCRQPTPEMYLGYVRADALANTDGYDQLAAAWYHPADGLAADQFDLSGHWLAMPQDIKNGSSEAGQYNRLRLHYRAQSVYLVAGTDNGNVVPVLVTQDGKSIAPAARGTDLRVDAGGQSYLPMAGQRMYYVVENPSFGEHLLSFQPTRGGAMFYSASFSNNCEAAFEHR
jgi:thiol-disulfide isomerase/thioredoxin